MDGKNLEDLRKVKFHWENVFSNILVLNGVNNQESTDDIHPYVTKLALIPVSHNSIFSDMIWDYNEETKNRAASVSKSKVKINFGLYERIPLGIIVEIKCMFLSVYSSPRDFGYKKSEVKPNTLISVFKKGLSFFDFLFYELEIRVGREYVLNKCSKISEITLLDFEEAAKKTKLKLTAINGQVSSYKSFFDFLNCLETKHSLGIECSADFYAIKKSFEKENGVRSDTKDEKLPYLETDMFNLALNRASFNVVSFLKSVGEKVNDHIMEDHYQILAIRYEEFPYTKQEFEDYGAYRMYQQGYSRTDINTTFPDNKVAKTQCNVEHKCRRKHKKLMPLKDAFIKAYYSALWVIGTLMGARPNVYSDLKVDGCLDLESMTIVSEEHKGRDNRWNLFNDRWVAIPIMNDAIKVIELIGGKIFKNTYIFANTFTSKPDEINTPLEGLSWTTKQSFEVITGLSEKDINSKLNGYVFRHSLAHQMYRADVGLPVISYQLKHIVTATNELARKGKVSQSTLGYGGIANQITSEESKLLDIRHIAELEAVKANFDPNAKYMGGKADEHLSKIKKFFNGCMEDGYTEEEIYEAMVKQGLAIINVGSGYCFGGGEDFDETLPCIGGLRCNPVRCANAIVTKANAPKWREIYLSNLKLIGAEGYEDRQDQIVEVIEESKRVLEYLGEALI
ncbi:hypothetical protein FCV43_04130 [Vibrio genomosp. F6]|uniref:hypothetical protein n=1 Tax=Vibrio genomosp. F6 TaxID=723172 RepID=UPI0010BCF17F|nr:hypothetical protein [Vibrio genomosp. F6]TKF23237.1 hypothetical protein FCV43_04130 [Vibrio genomosp. F6]